MNSHDKASGIDRRIVLGSAGALALLGASDRAPAQDSTSKAARMPEKRIRQMLAEFAFGVDLNKMPAEVIDRARIAFIDTIGVGIAGGHEEVTHIVAEMVKAEGSAPQTSIIGQSLRASPQLAALMNGVSVHAMDYDFSLIDGQSVAPVIPALLALAESTRATPAELLGAFVVGCEVATRFMRASPRLINGGGGWHSTGIIGCIAATAACARLMKLPVDKAAGAIGISPSLASGIAVNYGTMTKPLHSGNAARNAVMAASLASRGFTSHADAFEGNNGFFSAFGRALPTDFAPFNDLGSRWDLIEIGYRLKYYPSGGRGHAAIEAALILAEKLGPQVSEIAKIDCWVSESAAKRVNANYPPDVEAAKFSASYVIAYSLIHGAPKINAFTEAALRDERVRAMAALVTASADSNLSDAGGENPARLRITLKDGRTFEHQRDFSTGSRRLPMTPAQIEEKFMDCAMQTVSAGVAKKLFAMVQTIDKQPSFGDFWTLIRPS